MKHQNFIAVCVWSIWAHTILFCIVVFIFSDIYSQRILSGVDGNYMYLLAVQQNIWMPHNSLFGPNPFQALGNIFFPFNFNLMPPFAVQFALFGKIDPRIVQLILALELFISTIGLGIVADLSKPARILGAWIISILSFPLTSSPWFITTFERVPHYAELLAGFSVMVIAYWMLGRYSRRMSCLMLFLLVAVPCYLTMSNPLAVNILAPVTTGMIALLTLLSESRREFLWKIVGLFVGAMAIILTGLLVFDVFSTLYTAAYFFWSELKTHQTGLHHASVAFSGPLTGYGAPLVAIASLLGAAAIAVSRKGRKRWLAVFHLVATTLLIGGGYLLLEYLPTWRGPQGRYFEMALWPLYGLYAGALIVGSARFLASIAGRIGIRISVDQLSPLSVLLALTPTAALVLYSYAVPSTATAVPNIQSRVTVTEIVRPLKEALSLTPGDAFKGIVANFAGAAPESEITSWIIQHVSDEALVKRTGNDHRLNGLWAHNIPTLIEYNHWMTPPYFAVISRFLAHPQDRQVRNIFAFNRIDLDVLRLLGVRFLITSRPVDARASSGLRRVADGTGPTGLFLYEVAGPNLATYSPVKPVVASSARAVIEWMAGRPDYRNSVAVERALEGNFVAAQQTSLSVVPGGYDVSATSTGASILVLPIQYSRCWEVEATQGAPQIFRADLMLIGIRFEKRLSARLRFRAGPFMGSLCRARDMKDMKAIAIADIPDPGAAQSAPRQHDQ